MTMAEQIERKLQEAFAPSELEVVNESHRHAGHAGDDGSGESHFQIRIRAAAFSPMTRIARHRAIHAALGPDIVSQVHAMGLDVDG